MELLLDLHSLSACYAAYNPQASNQLLITGSLLAPMLLSKSASELGDSGLVWSDILSKKCRKNLLVCLNGGIS